VPLCHAKSAYSATQTCASLSAFISLEEYTILCPYRQCSTTCLILSLHIETNGSRTHNLWGKLFILWALHVLKRFKYLFTWKRERKEIIVTTLISYLYDSAFGFWLAHYWLIFIYFFVEWVSLDLQTFFLENNLHCSFCSPVLWWFDHKNQRHVKPVDKINENWC
jgi:hypothetical protein